MKAKIDLEKFICSLMKRFYKIHNIDQLTTKCWLDKVLEDQGLEYRDGEIVEIPQDSEDERIKKEILDLISISGNGNQFEEIKDWLEYKPQGKSALEAAKEENVDNQNCAKTTNKVEPKFNIGDWVIDKQDIVHQIANVIENVTNHTYGYDIVGGGYFNDNTEGVRLWTIQDAKNGDVLTTTHCNGIGQITFIFKRIIDDDMYCYCLYDSNMLSEKLCFDPCTDSDFIGCVSGAEEEFRPATKEQRDLLFQKMKEAGYEWDAEKKELKKIDTLLDLLNKMPSYITVDSIDYHFVIKKTSFYTAYYACHKGNGEEGRGNGIFGITAHSPIDLLTEMLEILKEKGLL